MTPSTPLYTADQLSAGYGGKPVLHELSFTLARNEILALIGPNGAGKTTLLRLMAGDLLPLSGSLQLNGQPVTELNRRTRARQIAYVPPTLDLMASMTVSEFVALGRTPHVTGWRRLSAKDHEAIESALIAMDLQDYAGRSVHELSEGERHRAMISLGLAQEPTLLLLDEPTAHLDIKHAWQTMERVHDLYATQGVSIIVTSHDLNLAAEFCSRLFLLDQGRLVANGTPTEVIEAALLSRVYDHPVEVVDHAPSGARRVFPVRTDQRRKEGIPFVGDPAGRGSPETS